MFNIMKAIKTWRAERLYRAIVDGSTSRVTSVIRRHPESVHRPLRDEMPLHLAADLGRTDIVALLLASGADANARSDFHGQHVLQACFQAYGGSAWCHGTLSEAELGDLFSVLIRYGADVNAKAHEYSGDDRTILHNAAYHGLVGVMRILVKGGAEVDAKDYAGETPLFHLVMTLGEGSGDRTEETIEFLLDNGADLRARDKGGLTLTARLRRDIREARKLDEYASCPSSEHWIEYLKSKGG